MKRTHLAIAALVVLSGCSSAKYTGKVVTCADNAPVADAALAWKSLGSTNDNIAGPMTRKTKEDGTYEANISYAEGNKIQLTITKDGFAPKKQTLAKDKAETLCIEPKNKQ